MNIKRAKEEIVNTVRAYLAKDADGAPVIPPIRQRPILLMGPPGIGKTQIMEQAARECGVALVAYTITHHTRQSAVGLPFIRQQHYGGKDVSVTEYTMSEIIASVYEKIAATGLSTGILFIDEINCVSETLAPTMLQFLQCKTFGNQAVPEGWLIAAAGNPPEYNKSVRDFDIVTLDRVRRIDVEPDLPVWKEYARAARLHPAILSYLELHPAHFYQVNNGVDGAQFVTARGWEDLSNLLAAYEALGLAADEALIGQYLQHKGIAADFAAYLDLYRRYRDDYGVEDILTGQARPAVFARLMNAPFDERLSLVTLLLAGLNNRFAACRISEAATDDCFARLKTYKKALADPTAFAAEGAGAAPDADTGRTAADTSAAHSDAALTPAALYTLLLARDEAEFAAAQAAGQLARDEAAARRRALNLLKEWQPLTYRAAGADAAAPAAETDADAAFAAVRGAFSAWNAAREAAAEEAAAALEHAFDFMEQAFAEGQEMVVFVTELTLGPAAHAFITENGCARYYQYSKDLLLDSRKAALRQELAAETARFGEM